MKQVNLISEETLKKYTLINDNMSGMYIAPAIKMVQDIDLETVIGEALVNKLKTLVRDNKINEEKYASYKLLLNNYVTPYMCYAVMAAVQININYKLTNSGVVSNVDEKKYNIDYTNGKNLQKQYERYSSAFAMKMKNYILNHIELYPEYRKCENYEVEQSPMLCGIYFDDDTDYRNYIGK